MNTKIHNLLLTLILLSGQEPFYANALTGNTHRIAGAGSESGTAAFKDGSENIFYKSSASGEVMQILTIDAIEKEEDDESKSNKKHRKHPKDHILQCRCGSVLHLIAVENAILSFHSPLFPDADRHIWIGVFRI